VLCPDRGVEVSLVVPALNLDGLGVFVLDMKLIGVSSPTSATVDLGDGTLVRENGRPTSLSSQTALIIGFPSFP
jgi:hypothetical protein